MLLYIVLADIVIPYIRCDTYFDMHIYSLIIFLDNLPLYNLLIKLLTFQRLREDISKYRQWLKEENVIWWEHFDVESVYKGVIDCG